MSIYFVPDLSSSPRGRVHHDRMLEAEWSSTYQDYISYFIAVSPFYKEYSIKSYLIVLQKHLIVKAVK